MFRMKREDIRLAIRECGDTLALVACLGETIRFADPDDEEWIAEAKAELDYRQKEDGF